MTAAADRLRERIEQMERDMTQLVIDLREGADRLRGDLDGLQAGTDELSAASAAPRRSRRAAAAPRRRAPAPAARAAKNGDSAAARIVALDMALSGTPREDTDQYLAENYDLPDRAALLDEVYAAAGAARRRPCRRGGCVLLTSPPPDRADSRRALTTRATRTTGRLSSASWPTRSDQASPIRARDAPAAPLARTRPHLRHAVPCDVAVVARAASACA